MNLFSKYNSCYELIDSGHGRKLERINNTVVIRPTPVAIWSPSISKQFWDEAKAVCHRSKDGGGHWEFLENIKDEDILNLDEFNLKIKIKLTSFGHCGIFFEQKEVWKQLEELVQKQRSVLKRAPKILNLFCYTGVAGLVMAKAGAIVDQVDSSKSILNWGKENQSLSEIENQKIRWIQEDALKFVKNCQKRGLKFDGILADPPSWGHGVKKEKWVFNDKINELVERLYSILNDDCSFFMLTSHSQGIQHHCLKNLLIVNKNFTSTNAGELGIIHQDEKRILPSGIYALGHSL